MQKKLFFLKTKDAPFAQLIQDFLSAVLIYMLIFCMLFFTFIFLYFYLVRNTCILRVFCAVLLFLLMRSLYFEYENRKGSPRPVVILVYGRPAQRAVPYFGFYFA